MERRPEVVSGKPTSVLVIRSGALGDTILTLPVLRRLREKVGTDGRVDFVGTLPAARLTRNARHATEVHSFDRGLFRALFVEGSDSDELRSFFAPFGLVVAFSRLPRLSRLLEGLGTAAIEASPAPPPGRHASDHLVSSLSPLGIGAKAPSPEIVISGRGRSEASRFLREHGLSSGNFVALHPSSGSPRKNWPAERFLELGLTLRQNGLDLLWVEGEADASLVAPLARDTGAPVARSLALETLAAVLESSAAFVGNDSGVSHLAAASLTPTIALFRATDPASWAPRGRRAQVVDWRASPKRVWGIAREILERQ